MAAPTNHYKLGLFVVLGFAAAIAVVVVLGARSLHKETTVYHTYFNESVQGLELGSPVKFRGVTIGHVSDIKIAPDHRMVDVTEELDVDDIERMGLTEEGKQKGKKVFSVPADLRAQLGSQGITGVKFIAIDFFDAKSNPVAQLPFPPVRNHIPSAASLMKNLEDTVTHAMEKLPELVDAVVTIVGRIDRMMAGLERDNITGKAAATMGHADDVLTQLSLTLGKVDKANLPEKTAGTIEQLNTTVAKMNKVIDRIDGEAGLIASAQRSVDSFGEMGRRFTGSSRDLDEAMKEIRDAAEAIRILAEALEKDPDMLIKGRGAVKGKSK